VRPVVQSSPVHVNRCWQPSNSREQSVSRSVTHMDLAQQRSALVEAWPAQVLGQEVGHHTARQHGPRAAAIGSSQVVEPTTTPSSSSLSPKLACSVLSGQLHLPAHASEGSNVSWSTNSE
jgi:hypothetical protein